MIQTLWFLFLLTVVQCLNQEEIVTEGKSVTVKCFSTKSSLDSGVYWFQQTEGRDAKFLVFTSSIGTERNKKDNRFKSSRSGQGYSLTFTFKKDDAGIYYCFQVSNNNMEFGTSTKISVKKAPQPATTTKAPANATTQPATARNPPCTCPARGKPRDTRLTCDVFIWAPLSGAAGLLLVILVITIIMCSKVRTRRCPHHYKKRPLKDRSGRPSVPDRYV
ncbi:T-cell surface glycoprotein CD8 alpha chain-like [Acipenser ruthenus]|uniref:T-cell surface glycoprotein CD8 alpha chain-like n=1 Tax=Acipenser ruthenus TaxID=7906 RepID=UPI002741A11A|nr:T-cell surface glycoprotein CD8 alpha chain-like [Acipenser ruthenus]